MNTDDEIEGLAMALAIADRYGLESDSEEQRLLRIHFYKNCLGGFTETTEYVDTEECGTVFIRGKDHWRMLAKLALEYKGGIKK